MSIDLLARMRESLQLNGLSVKTQDAYLRAMRLLCDFAGCSPDQLSEEHLRRNPSLRGRRRDSGGCRGNPGTSAQLPASRVAAILDAGATTTSQRRVNGLHEWFMERREFPQEPAHGP